MARIFEWAAKEIIHTAVFIVVAIAGMFWATRLQAQHEAIFGPQSATLISQKRFVSTQYYHNREGRLPSPRSRSHIGVVSVGRELGESWGVSVTFPFEAERDTAGGSETGTQDLVFGIRRFADLGNGNSLMGVLTLEPPTTGTLEHNAFGVGGGLLYGKEWEHWSVLAYGLGRTESSFETGERRGDRLFLGGGIGYESHGWPLTPQLGFSWERTGRSREAGVLSPESDTSALLLHPTLFREIGHAVQTFVVVSVPVAQGSGSEGWQRFRVAAGMVWQF